VNYNAKYVVRLTEEERKSLHTVVKKGKVAAAKRSRAQILLKADAGPNDSGLSDLQIAEALGVAVSTVHRTRQQYVEEGWSRRSRASPLGAIGRESWMA